MTLVKGFGYLLQGARLLSHPGLRLFVLLPLLVNIIMFGVGLLVLISFVGGWMGEIVAWLPEWMGGITSFLWFLLVILFGMAVFFSFNLLANFIAAPLNGLLAEKVQLHLTGKELAFHADVITLLLSQPIAKASQIDQLKLVAIADGVSNIGISMSHG